MKLKYTMLLLALSAGVTQAASTVYRNAILADSPVAYYEFDETAGTVAADSSGNGYDATYTGSHTLSASTLSNLGTAVDLTGGYIDVGSVGGAHANLSIEAWIQLDTHSGISSIWSTDGYSSGNSHVAVNPGFGIQNASPLPNAADLNTAGSTIALSTWHHVVVTIDGAGGATANNIYVDGSLVATGSRILGTHNMDTSQIGGYLGTRLLDGRVDEVALYDTALSQAQVSAHFAAATVPEPSSAALLGLAGLALILRRRK